jgi:hypothetical protein
MERQKEVIISDSETRGLAADNYKTIIKMRDKYDHKFQSIIKRGVDKGIFAETDHKILSYAIITMCTAVSIWFNPPGTALKRRDCPNLYRFYSQGNKSMRFSGLKIFLKNYLMCGS